MNEGVRISMPFEMYKQRDACMEGLKIKIDHLQVGIKNYRDTLQYVMEETKRLGVEIYPRHGLDKRLMGLTKEDL